MKQLEHGLQVAVARMLELCLDPERTWWSGLDHAAKLSPRYGADRKRRGVKPGLPDFIVMPRIPYSSQFLVRSPLHALIGIELKTKKGRLSPSQIAVSNAWTLMGHSIYVARSLKEVQEVLDHCRVPMRRRMTVF